MTSGSFVAEGVLLRRPRFVRRSPVRNEARWIADGVLHVGAIEAHAARGAPIEMGVRACGSPWQRAASQIARDDEQHVETRFLRGRDRERRGNEPRLRAQPISIRLLRSVLPPAPSARASPRRPRPRAGPIRRVRPRVSRARTARKPSINASSSSTLADSARRGSSFRRDHRVGGRAVFFRVTRARLEPRISFQSPARTVTPGGFAGRHAGNS